MGNSKVVSGSVLSTQKESNYFSDPYFSLREGFTEKIKILDVEALTKRGEDTPYAHRVIVKGAKGTFGLHAGLLAKAILIKDTKSLKDVVTVKDGIKSIWYADDVQALGTPFSELYERDADGGYKDFTYPDEMEIVGAYVFPAHGDEDHPQVGLRNYPLYSVIKRHHAKITDDYITFDEIEAYCNANGDARPEGLPAGFKFELPEGAKWQMNLWNFRLIIKDWR